MAKRILLDIVQNILSAMGSDEVNSISDTTEAEMVASIVKDAYYNLISSREFANNKVIFNLEGLGDTSNPTRMKIPENISKVEFIKYDRISSTGTVRQTTEITYLDPRDFLQLIDGRDNTASTVTEVVDSSGVLLNIITDTPPQYWTSFDDEYVVFDSYDSAEESTVQGSKTTCYGLVDPSFTSTEPDAWVTSTVYTLGDVVQNASNVYKATSSGTSGGTAPTHTTGTTSDGTVNWIFVSSLTNYYDDYFIPDLPAHLFPLLIAEAKSTCFAQIKQMPDVKSEQFARRLRVQLQQDNWRNEQERDKFYEPYYGRK